MIDMFSVRLLSTYHFIQTFLHILQMGISYLLMLIAMTFNVYLFLAVILGAGLGHLLFGWRRTTVIDRDEHCHWKSHSSFIWYCAYLFNVVKLSFSFLSKLRLHYSFLPPYSVWSFFVVRSLFRLFNNLISIMFNETTKGLVVVL